MGNDPIGNPNSCRIGGPTGNQRKNFDPAATFAGPNAGPQPGFDRAELAGRPYELVQHALGFVAHEGPNGMEFSVVQEGLGGNRPTMVRLRGSDWNQIRTRFPCPQYGLKHAVDPHLDFNGIGASIGVVRPATDFSGGRVIKKTHRLSISLGGKIGGRSGQFWICARRKIHRKYADRMRLAVLQFGGKIHQPQMVYRVNFRVVN